MIILWFQVLNVHDTKLSFTFLDFHIFAVQNLFMKLFFLVFLTFLLTTTLFAQLPVDYYKGANNLSCSDLKSALKQIISSGVNPQSYAALWNQYPITDIKPRTIDSGSATVIYDIYSSIPDSIDPYQFAPITNQCGTYKGEGGCYNREHSVPLSWFNGNTSINGAATDYNFIFPTDGHVNGKRSNFPYGEVAKANFTSKNGSKLGPSALAGITGLVFEPRDEFKGDVARAFLYFVTRYEDSIPSWSNNTDASQSFGKTTFPGVTLPFLQMMLRWNAIDPVSQKEIDRNNGTYSFQNNRNPYIDSPQFVNRVWSITCPELISLPLNSVYLSGKQDGKYVLLKVEINDETNLSECEIQKRTTETDYSTIRVIQAEGKNRYSLTDNIANNIGTTVFYRLKKNDKNGTSTYSDVLKIDLSKVEEIEIYPNPVNNMINIKTDNYSSKNVEITLNDALGRCMLRKTVLSDNGQLHLSTQNIPRGNYYLKLIIGEKSYSKVVIIAR